MPGVPVRVRKVRSAHRPLSPLHDGYDSRVRSRRPGSNCCSARYVNAPWPARLVRRSPWSLGLTPERRFPPLARGIAGAIPLVRAARGPVEPSLLSIRPSIFSPFISLTHLSSLFTILISSTSIFHLLLLSTCIYIYLLFSTPISSSSTLSTTTLLSPFLSPYTSLHFHSLTSNISSLSFPHPTILPSQPFNFLLLSFSVLWPRFLG